MYGTEGAKQMRNTLFTTFRNDVDSIAADHLGTRSRQAGQCIHTSQPSIDIAKACRSIRYVFKSEDAASDMSVLQIKLSIVL
jgi:hypothetical protein